MREYSEQESWSSDHSWFWRWRRRNGNWGGFRVHPMASFDPRGGMIRIVGYNRATNDGPRLDVYLSDAGRSFRVYLDDREMVVEQGERR